MTRHTYWKIAKESVGEFREDSPFQLAAALSFYTLLSLSPLVLIVSLIMFLGAEITFVYAQHRRRRVRPTELAVTADR